MGIWRERKTANKAKFYVKTLLKHFKRKRIFTIYNSKYLFETEKPTKKKCKGFCWNYSI